MVLISLHRRIKAQRIIDLGYQADIRHGYRLANALLSIAVKRFKVIFQGTKTRRNPVVIPMQFLRLI